MLPIAKQLFICFFLLFCYLNYLSLKLLSHYFMIYLTKFISICTNYFYYFSDFVSRFTFNCKKKLFVSFLLLYLLFLFFIFLITKLTFCKGVFFLFFRFSVANVGFSLTFWIFYKTYFLNGLFVNDNFNLRFQNYFT